MKLIFFLIAFCLVFLRVYFSGPWIGKKDKDDVTITIKNGEDYEQIRYGGKIALGDDLNSIKSISPGGYIKYKKNDLKVVIESNLQGDITYIITDDGNQLLPGYKSNAFITEAVKEMIAYGFDPQTILERIYANGGNAALLRELDSLKSPDVIGMYVDHLLIADSTGQYTIVLINKVGRYGSDQDKMFFMNKLTGTKLKSAEATEAYFSLVQHLGSDNDKVKMLKRWPGTDSIGHYNFIKMLELTAHLGSDYDKINLLNSIITSMPKDSVIIQAYFDIVQHLGSDNDKINIMRNWTKQDSIPKNIIDNILNITTHLGFSNDKQNMIHALIAQKNIAEEDWLLMINAASQMGSDEDKSNVLIGIAQKMPGTENIKTAYRKVAKLINNETDYGKAMKAIE